MKVVLVGYRDWAIDILRILQSYPADLWQIQGVCSTEGIKYLKPDVILFGSQARGDFTPYSDVDLILIGDFKEKFMKRASKLLTYNKSNLNIEICCYTKKEFEKMFSDGNALILDAIYEGLPLKGDDFFKLYKSRFDEMIKKGLKRSNCTWILV